MGAHLEKVTAVMVFNGMITPFECVTTYKGKPIVKPPVSTKTGKMDFSEDNVCTPRYDVFKDWLGLESPLIITAENASDDTHFLHVSGSQCGVYSWLGGMAFEHQMKMKGKTNVERIMYPGGPHILDPPYNALAKFIYQNVVPYRPSFIKSPYPGSYIYYGGEVEALCKAQEEIWPKALGFLKKHVMDESPWYQKNVKNKSKL